jgi:hypothetical protein
MGENMRQMSRRKMVLASAAALGAVGAFAARPTGSTRLLATGSGSQNPAPVAAGKRAPPLGALSNWRAAVGSDFYVRTANGSILTRLTAVSPFPARGVRPKELARQEAFILSFDTGRVQAPQGEGIYTVTHRTMGEMKIFLSASTVSATSLTAVFN